MPVSVHFLLWCLGLERATTQTTDAERDCLARCAAGRRRVVEIGVWHGVTTRRLRAALAPGGVLFAVDPFPVGRMRFSPQRVIARRQVAAVSTGRVEWVRLTGEEAARWYASRGEPGPDLVFIDGDHSYDGLRRDWEAWSGLLAAGGLVALHDSRSTEARPIEEAGSVHFTTGVILHDPRFEVAEVVDSLTVLRRRPG